MNASDDKHKNVARIPVYSHEFKELNLSMVLLQETRISGPNEIVIEGYRCYFPEIPVKRRKQGLGIAVKLKWVECVTDQGFINSLIMWIAGTFDGFDTAFINHYAPTMDITSHELQDGKDHLSIEVHYAQLSQVWTNLSRKFDRIYIAGDANGRVGGMDTEVWDTELGIYIQDEECNTNGMFLLEFARKERLTIMNSMFSQEVYGTGTYHAPGSMDYSITLDYLQEGIIWDGSQEGRG